MIDPEDELPISRQTEILQISRSSVYYKPRPVSEADLWLMRCIDELHLNYPFAGSRLLRDLAITRPNQVWSTDISYIPMARGFVYLVAVIDWFSRRVLAWKLSITMDTSFCIEALEETLSRNDKPEIFNTDQGSQFTSEAFTGRLKKEAIAISMDGKGRWCDNVFIERFWKSIKYEHVYLHAYESVEEARTKIGGYIDFYNTIRPHSSLKARTPDQVYFNRPPEALAA